METADIDPRNTDVPQDLSTYMQQNVGKPIHVREFKQLECLRGVKAFIQTNQLGCYRIFARGEGNLGKYLTLEEHGWEDPQTIKEATKTDETSIPSA